MIKTHNILFVIIKIINIKIKDPLRNTFHKFRIPAVKMLSLILQISLTENTAPLAEIE